MKRHHVDSSMATSVGYDATSKTLEIGFRSGEVWQYYDVPRAAYREMISGSIGKYFQHHQGSVRGSKGEVTMIAITGK